MSVIRKLISLKPESLVLEDNSLERLLKFKGPCKGIGVILSPNSWETTFLSCFMDQELAELPSEPGLYFWKNSQISPRYFFLYLVPPVDREQIAAQLFSVMFLTTSVIIYNSRGAIELDSFAHLLFIARMKDVLLFQQSLSAETNKKSLNPDLIWCMSGVDSFLLETINSEEYIDSIFAGDYSDQVNEVINGLRKNFGSIVGKTLPNPSCHGNKQGISQKYLEHIDSLIDDLHNTRMKRFGNKGLTFEFVVVIVKHLVSSYNVKPNCLLDFSWNSIIYSEYMNMEEIMEMQFSRLMGNILSEKIYDEEELIHLLFQAKDQCKELLYRDRLLFNEKFQVEANSRFEKHFIKWFASALKENSDKSKNFNTKVLDKLYKETKANISTAAENIEALETAWGRILEIYERKAKGPTKLTVLVREGASLFPLLYGRFYKSLTKDISEEKAELLSEETCLQKKLETYQQTLADQMASEMQIEQGIRTLGAQANIPHYQTDDILNELIKKLRKNPIPAFSNKTGCNCLLF